MNILIVDDEQELTNELALYFESKEDKTICACNGIEAWQKFNEADGSFDLLITDQRMPQMSGIELANKLRNQGYRTPIILMSGDGEIQEENLTHIPSLKLVSKPTRISKLESTISQLQQESNHSSLPLKKNGFESESKRILVVDDEPLICELLTEVLMKAGYQTNTATNGIEGLKTLQENNHDYFDLIIVDLKMPVMNGTSFIQKLKESNIKTPIIVFTGHADLDDAYRLLDKYQIADFINKPIESRSRLLFSIKNALDKHTLSFQLRELNDSLEKRVLQRTQDLEEAKRAAESANLAKSTFLARMSHELRTPLNAILGFAQLQDQSFGELDDKTFKSCNENIISAGWHLLSLTNDVLDIVQVENGQLELSLAPCSLNIIIKDAIKTITAEAEENNISIDYQQGEFTVNADPTRLTQVIINLLSNSVKFNRKGGCVKISVTQNNKQHFISIADTGIGIEPEFIETIFEPFSRLTYAEENEIQGAGVGLSLSKYLVERMNGEIWAESELNRGSVFIVRLDRASPH